MSPFSARTTYSTSEGNTFTAPTMNISSLRPVTWMRARVRPHSHLSVLTYPMSPERKRIIGRAFFMSVV